MTASIAEPVPWTFTDVPGVLQWTWLTEHFVARVTGTEVAEPAAGERRLVRTYAWDLSDLIRQQQGLPRLIVEGASADFEDAESRIREHVGKAYDPILGYRRFAGPLAFTFTLSTGESIDVSSLLGTRCAVTVLMPDRTERTVVGTLDVDHYKWRLTTADEVMQVVPEHVMRITNRSAAAERASAVVRNDSYTGVGRIYSEEPRRGCTGRPGYLPRTVDHAGAPRCPIHEAGVPDALLR